jgi:hypothetical protein
MEPINLPAYHKFYFDINNQSRNNGIYCPGLDRWILVDSYDFWITLETAQILSSKIASMVYLLPNDLGGMTNENSLSYSIKDKSQEKKGKVADLISSQIPSLRIGKRPTFAGVPVDFDFDIGLSALNKLKLYAEYVNKCLYATNLVHALMGHTNNLQFSTNYFPTEWTDQVTLYSDRSNLHHGILKEIKRILYFGKSVESAREQISKLLENNYLECDDLINKFYSFMDESPEFLQL